MVKAGLLSFTRNGKRLLAKGNFTYNLGLEKREEIVGSDGLHGFKVGPGTAMIEGEVTNTSELDTEELFLAEDETIQLNLRDGKIFVLRNASYAGEGSIETEEGNIGVRFVGAGAREIRP